MKRIQDFKTFSSVNEANLFSKGVEIAKKAGNWLMNLVKAQDKNEAFDYLMNSKEWADIIEYEKWAEEYLRRHQQSTSLPTSATKQQIQY